MVIKRRYTRWQIDRQAKIKLEGESASRDCTIQEISFSGAKICLSQKLALDTNLKLNISLSNELSFDLEAWVVWHKLREGLNLYGLYFTKIKDADKEKISKFIRTDFTNEINKQWWQETGEERGGEKMDDRRIFARFNADFPLRFIDLNQNREGAAQVADISAKGVGFLVNEEIKSRTPLEMWLQIPDRGEPLYTRGEVVWSKRLEPNKYRIGVSLEKADFMGMSRVLRAG
jgi:hypothetical protein